MVEGNGPSYISAHSADVILSDIRPIKLKPEGLRAINVLLDEFLAKILSTSSSLVTDKLRASLLSLLPTSLGKEALLEAEVELRAYWDRTDPKAVPEDDSRTFHLQWAFSLLRVKCEAYSTLNEEDEDPDAEGRVNQMFSKAGSHPPMTSLVDPAALYLTAILESMCEHILSNVGRVAARDSSRTSATVNDIFVALCEDDAIYGLFKTMKVYEQIEQMSKSNPSRRSQSISRQERYSTSRTSSPHLEPSQQTQSYTSQQRQSFEGQAPAASSVTSRTSFEKSRAMRMFSNSKSNSEADAQSSHKKSESLRSEASRPYTDEDPLSPEEDEAMLREFDDLMRSASTMKVSLTPDRLKTMEVYKQEKDAKNITGRGGLHVTTSQPSTPLASRPGLPKPLLRQVDPINEDEEESNSPKARTRQVSVTTPPPSATFVPISAVRSRSISTSSGLRTTPFTTRPTRSPSITSPPSSFISSNTSVDMSQARDFRKFNGHDNSNGGFPPRTRVKQRNRDSLDLDDIMNGSDDDQNSVVNQHQVSKPQQPSIPSTPKRPAAVSTQTRDLMDFLEQGPPEPQGRGGNGFASDFSMSGLPEPDVKPKGTNRLQRMISKLNLGNEKAKADMKAQVKPPMPIAVMPTPPRLPNMNISSAPLANRPVIPHPPRPVSPPSSPSISHGSSDESKSFRNTPRRPYQDTSVSRETSFSASEKPAPEKPTAYPISPVSSGGPAKREAASERYIPTDSPTLSGNTYTPSSSVSGHGYSTPTGSVYAPSNDNGNRHPGTVSPNGSSYTQHNGRYHGGTNVPARDRPFKDVLNDSQPIVPLRTTSFASPARKPVPSVASSRGSQAPSPPPTFAYAPAHTSPPPPVQHARQIPQSHLASTTKPVKFAPPPARAQAPPPAEPVVPPVISEGDIRDMQRLLSSASTADECRLIFDMYLARNKIPKEPKIPYPSPSPSVVKASAHAEKVLETSVVELFLGGSRSQQRVAQNTEAAAVEGLPSTAAAVAHNIEHTVQHDTDVFTPSPAPTRYMAPISA